MLYDQRCSGCHGQSVHSRTRRIALSCPDVRAFVARWAEQAGAGWTEDELEDVTLHLNQRYYGFPVRDGRCLRSIG